MRYFLLPANLKPYASLIQERVWEMARPTAERNPEDVTISYAGYVTNPATGDIALAMPEILIPLHHNNLPDRLIQYLQSVLTAAQQTQVRNYVINHRGEMVDVLAMLAGTFFPARIRTEAEINAWFNTGE